MKSNTQYDLEGCQQLAAQILILTARDVQSDKHQEDIAQFLDSADFEIYADGVDLLPQKVREQVQTGNLDFEHLKRRNPYRKATAA